MTSEVVAKAFDLALGDMGGGPTSGPFRRVVFAILVKSRRDEANVAPFQARFG